MPILDDVTLAGYLNGHLRVSDASLRLMSRISREFGDAELSSLLHHLSREVREEQGVVRVIIGAAGGHERRRRPAVPWVVAPVGRWRAWATGRVHGVRLLETLETLIASFTRRRSLWLALAALPRGLLPSPRLDCAAFAARVREQIDALEAWRLGCAASALVRHSPIEVVDRTHDSIASAPCTTAELQGAESTGIP